MSDDEDIPQLSAETFAALQEFYKEQENKEMKLEKSIGNPLEENWQLSQFWYDETTIATLVKIAIKSIANHGNVALISCPSLYQLLRNNLSQDFEVVLFEFDSRFSCFGSEFIPYDYKYPLKIPRCKENYYDLVIADPPFLSDECLTNTAVTIQYLAKQKIILCTGAIMTEMATKLLKLEIRNFIPKHKNNLANEFRCFTNFDINEYIL